MRGLCVRNSAEKSLKARRGWTRQCRRLREARAGACSRLRLAAFAQRFVVRRKRLELRLVEPAKGAVAKEGDKQALARRSCGAGRLVGAVRVGHLPRPARVAVHACPHQVAALERHRQLLQRDAVLRCRALQPRDDAGLSRGAKPARSAQGTRGKALPVLYRQDSAASFFARASGTRRRFDGSGQCCTVRDAALSAGAVMPLPVLLNIGSALSAIFWPHAAASTSGAAVVAGSANAAKDASVAGAAASGSSAAATGAKVRHRSTPRTQACIATPTATPRT